MDITPHTNLLKSLRGERTSYLLLIGEGVDNALDAGASKVVIDLARDHIQFRDNGSGIRSVNIEALFSLGKHANQSTTALGRFGVGITSQAVNAGDIFKVTSTSADGRFHIAADWRAVLSSGSWCIEDPHFLPVQVGAATQTIITIGQLRRAPRVSLSKIAEDLAICFRPALADGRSIVLNDREILAVPEPSLTDVIERQIALSGDRSASVRAGMLVGPSQLNMVHVGYRHRVIMPSCRLGCGTTGGISKMFARVQLSGPWHFAKFKDDLPDDGERDELEDALSVILQPILEKCDSASITARIHNITSKINDLMPPALRPSRPRKGEPRSKDGPSMARKSKQGTVSPDKSDISQTGPALAMRRPKDQLIVNFDGSDAQHGYGHLIQGRPHCVSLSPDNPYIASLIELRDQDFGARALLSEAFGIYAQARGGNAPELPFESFGKQLAYLMSIQGESSEDINQKTETSS